MTTIIVSIISSISVILTTLIQTIGKNDLKKIENKIDKVHIDALKNFITRSLSDIDKGIEINEATKMRLYEAYDIYINEYKQNTYIHDEWERLHKEGKL